jgi:hypothetical protein
MYKIVQLSSDEYECEVTIQDGFECWREPTLEKAIQAVISAAWTLNGVRINRKMIDMLDGYRFATPEPPKAVSKKDLELLEQIRTRHKVVLDFDDYRLKSNLLPEEVDMLYEIRQGTLEVVPSHK